MQTILALAFPKVCKLACVQESDQKGLSVPSVHTSHPPFRLRASHRACLQYLLWRVSSCVLFPHIVTQFQHTFQFVEGDMHRTMHTWTLRGDLSSFCVPTELGVPPVLFSLKNKSDLVY